MNQNPIHDFWFDKSVEEIYIVTMRESMPKKDAYKISNDYAYCDNCGDLDLLFGAYGLLNRFYPNAKISFFYAEDFKRTVRDWEKKNILVLGGPNTKNDVCRFFMYEALPKIYADLENYGHSPKVKIIYPPKSASAQALGESKKYSKEYICAGCAKISQDCPRTALCKKYSDGRIEIIEPQYDEAVAYTLNSDRERDLYQSRILESIDGQTVILSGCLSYDIGFFACFSNIYDEHNRNRIVMINGAHTFGGVGVLHAVDAQSKKSLRNYNLIAYELFGQANKDFVCHFNVEVSEDRNIITPTLYQENLVPLSKEAGVNLDTSFSALYNIFISYRRRNGGEASQLVYDVLSGEASRYIHPFRDIMDFKSGFRPGVDYVKDIRKKIDNIPIFILIVTPQCLSYTQHFAGSFFDEFTYALKTGKLIVPIQFDGGSYDAELLNVKEDLVNIVGEELFEKAVRINAINYDKNVLFQIVNEELKNVYGKE